LSGALFKQLSLAALGGALYFLGFVGFDVYPLEWICFVPILVAIRGTRPRRALLLGACFGVATNMGGYYWVVHLLHEFAHLNYALAALGYLLLSAYQGFLLALVVYLVHAAEARLEIAPVWTLPIVFSALELAYPLLFPSYIGNSQYRFTAVTQIVELTGMAGLTVLISAVNGALFEPIDAFLSKRRIAVARIAVPLALFGATVVYGVVRLPSVDGAARSARTIEVALVQTNLGARDKWADARAFIDRHQEMTRELIRDHPEVDLVVWPESAFNEWIYHGERNLKRRVLEGIDRPVIFGTLSFGEERRGRRDTFNSAVLTSSTGQVLGIYDKIELLAFGETAPLFVTFPVLREWFPGIPAFASGTQYAPLVLEGTPRRGLEVKLLPTICYEDILPGLVRMLWKRGGPAGVLVNLTNDSWYGDTHEPLIHLVLASFRAIETRRALIRATNTGISAIVDPAGRIIHRTGQWTKETLIAPVPVIDSGEGTIFMAIGDVIGWTSLVLTIAGLVFLRLRAARNAGAASGIDGRLDEVEAPDGGRPEQEG
jgi:apolipoprotein N-acyltransferase